MVREEVDECKREFEPKQEDLRLDVGVFDREDESPSNISGVPSTGREFGGTVKLGSESD